MGEIFKQLDGLVKNRYKFFTTPGHKQGNAYKKFKKVLKYDLTEVKGLDNLHNPKFCISYSLNKLKDFYGSGKSYYLLNGSTSGIQIIIFSFFNEYDEILIERGCHVSVINSISLRKLKVNYINREIYNLDFLLPDGYMRVNYNVEDIILNEIKSCIEKNPKIRGVFLTNPNYYGIYINQEKIYEYLRNKNIFLIIDSAHGAHINSFNRNLICTNKFCDASVMSAHKTLASFTQGAYLHINNEKFIDKSEKYFSIFMTTSPSYLIMLSLEKSLNDCEKYKDSTKLLEKCNDFRKAIYKNGSLSCISDKYVFKKSNGNFRYDDTRICLKFRYSKFDSNKLEEVLLANKIFCEMVFFNGVVLIPTIYTRCLDFKVLKKVLKKFNISCEENNIFDVILNLFSLKSEKVLEFYELESKKYSFIKLEYSYGYIAYDDVILYPPGSPVIIRGEKIFYEHVIFIKESIKKGYNIIGIYNGYLKILEE